MPRVMELATPLGEDVLLFHRMRAQEEVSRVPEFQLDLLSLKGDIALNDILGQNVTVTLMVDDDTPRYFNGFVSRFSQGRMLGRYHRYYAVVRPWLWFLSRTTDCRIFQEMTVPDIVKSVLADEPASDVKFELTGHYRKWTYCVQYRETDLNFVSRLLEHEGIYYYFKYEPGKNTLIVTDSYSGHETFPGAESVPFIDPERLARPELGHVDHWLHSGELQPGRYVHTDYDFERPSVNLRAQKAVSRRHAASSYEVFDYPGLYAQKGDGESYASVRLDEYGAQFETAQASANHHGIAVGYLFTLDGHPQESQNREYLVLAANTDLEYSSYEALPDRGGASCRCAFVAMSSKQQYRPRRLTPKPFVQGPQTAVVVGPAGDEIYTDKYGRVKVQFYWDRVGQRDENSSCWIRVSHPWAGKGWGSVSIPRIGQEVIVDFLEGDPDQPIITGRVYNAESMPPYGLPAAGVISGLKSNTHKGKGFNEMSMDDTAGKEKITIHAQYDMNTLVEHDQTNTVQNDFTETIKQNATITISEGKLSHDVKAGTALYHVKGAIQEDYDDSQKTTVKNAIDYKSTAGPINVTSDSAHIALKAATYISLECGASKIKLDSAGNISIEGVVVGAKGSTSVTIKGGTVDSVADSKHQTKGAIVISEGSATNTVKGGMVMLN